MQDKATKLAELLLEAIQLRLDAVRTRRLTEHVQYEEREIELEQALARTVEELKLRRLPRPGRRTPEQKQSHGSETPE